MAVLSELNARKTPYALLHPGDDTLPDVSSDVDIILSEHPSLSLLPALHVLEEGGATWTQSLHYDAPYGFFYVIQVPYDDGLYAYLQLDCLYDPYGINRYHLSSSFLLQERQFSSGYYRTSISAETLYLLIKRSLKANATENNTRDLLTNLRKLHPQLSDKITHWFGSQLAKNIINASINDDHQKLVSLLNNAGRYIESRFALQHPIKLIHKKIRSAARQIKRFVSPTGMFIVLIGPDGCGKTTISNDIRNSMLRNFRAVWRFHWRPGLLPKPGKKTQNASDNASDSTNTTPPAPPDKAKYNTLVSFIRFTYYLFDFVVGYWLVIYPKKARSTFIVGERYFADILVHPVRYGFSLPKWVLRAGAFLVPKPDIIILLSGDAQRIHDRKPELPVPLIASQILQYKMEIPQWGEHFIADTNKSAKNVVNQIETHLGQLMHDRVAGHKPDNVLAFPRWGRTRLLLAPSITNRNLDSLFSPSSMAGKLGLLAVKYLPGYLKRLVARNTSSRHFSGFPRVQADKIIKKQFSEYDNLSISYYMGNGGPRAKVTAQVCSDNAVIAYVKIAGTEAARELLSNEAEALSAIHPVLGDAAPERLATEYSYDWSYLFTSAPDSTYRPCATGLNKEHTRIVAMIHRASCNTITYNDYQSRHKLKERVADIPFQQESIKKTCLDALESIQTHFSGRDFITARNHGDFTPWNLLYNKHTNRLYLFDWEYSDPAAPALSDITHYLRSVSHLIHHHAPEKTAECILTSRHIHDFASTVNIDISDTPYYVAIYLVLEILRHSESDNIPTGSLEFINQQKLADFLSKCLNTVQSAASTGIIPRRVCVTAYACEPNRGSEPGVGWEWSKLISKNNQAWVMTKANNRHVIEEHLKRHPAPSLNFVYINVPKWLSFWKKGQRGVRTYYYLWLFFALLKLRKLHKQVDFEFGHHVTFVNDWLWSSFALGPIPYIWGPIGSHPRIPSQLLPHNKAKAQELVRLLIQRTMRIIDPLFWLTAIKATRVIGINNETFSQFPLNILTSDKSIVECAIAHDADISKPQNMERKNQILYVGRFHHTKCPHIALESFAKLCASTTSHYVLTMVGKGPEEENLKALAIQLGISNKVNFIEWRDQQEVFALMASSKIFLFPSTEGGGMVVIEAMAHGLPIISLKYGGPGVLVNSNCGFKADISSKDEVINELARAMSCYINDEKLHYEHSSNAARHALTSLSWKAKQKCIDALYDELFPPAQYQQQRHHTDDT